jgi:uncharacterized protein with NAD-binding domain and iron-sulfur cluster
MAAQKKKIVIIGGGISGLAAAFGLTTPPNWQDQYEITVLQLGWRLGGKGASGRNAAAQQRIEEHGLHVWGGFYENAFRVMRACYTELNRPPNSPLATWDEAFKPSAMVSWMEDRNGSWLPWNNSFPEYPQSTPGDGTPMPSLLEGILRVIEWIIQTALEPAFTPAARAPGMGASKTATPTWIERLVADAEMRFAMRMSADWKSAPLFRNKAYSAEMGFLADAYKLLRAAQPDDPKAHPPEVHEAAVWLLRTFRQQFGPRARDAAQSDDGLRRAAILVDLGLTEVIGMLSDGVLLHGFNVIDNEDLMAWLRRHGAAPESVNSAVIRGTYDFIFAYKQGDPLQPALAAGAGLRCIFRLIMWYKGAIFWKMQAGMGDTVFAPLYLVLKNRGVTFRFFQKVENLGLSEDQTSIATLQVSEQATVTTGEYEPLYDVNNLPCWPNAPFYDQLVQGNELKAQGINLEDPWSPWPPVNTYTLQAGQDFDTVILATSFAPLKEICAELITVSPAWTRMVQSIQTVQTQAFQLWLTPSLSELGWSAGPTVLTAFAHPDETWADMSQVVPREVWPVGQEPGSIAYFCGPLLEVDPIPPYSDHDFPAQQAVLVQEESIRWVDQNLPLLWPAAGAPANFNWNLLDDPLGGSGPARFTSQYWRANLSPAERYVLSVPGSTQYRLGPAGSRFANLYLAGDWTLNGLNFGCIESATMGGLEVSQAICGYPSEIVGVNDL